MLRSLYEKYFHLSKFFIIGAPTITTLLIISEGLKHQEICTLEFFF